MTLLQSQRRRLYLRAEAERTAADELDAHDTGTIDRDIPWETTYQEALALKRRQNQGDNETMSEDTPTISIPVEFEAIITTYSNGKPTTHRYSLAGDVGLIGTKLLSRSEVIDAIIDAVPPVDLNSVIKQSKSKKKAATKPDRPARYTDDQILAEVRKEHGMTESALCGLPGVGKGKVQKLVAAGLLVCDEDSPGRYQVAEGK